MAKCKKCGKETGKKYYYYCNDCYNSIIEICLCCGEYIFLNDKYHYLISNDKQTICCNDCYNIIKNQILSSIDKNVIINTRDRFLTKFRCEDGHKVRSSFELAIDNYFYNHNIKHCYEKEVKISEDEKCTCDWYLPDYDLYVEYWGIEDNEEYNNHKEHSLKIYESCKLNLLELFPDDFKNQLDDKIQYELFKYKKRD